MYRDWEDNSWTPESAERRTSGTSRHHIPLPWSGRIYEYSWVISLLSLLKAQKQYSQANSHNN